MIGFLVYYFLGVLFCLLIILLAVEVITWQASIAIFVSTAVGTCFVCFEGPRACALSCIESVGYGLGECVGVVGENAGKCICGIKECVEDNTSTQTSNSSSITYPLPTIPARTYFPDENTDDINLELEDIRKEKEAKERGLNAKNASLKRLQNAMEIDENTNAGTSL